MKISLNLQAELEPVEGAACYAREANADIANALISEFDRSAKLLAEFPKLGATLARSHSSPPAPRRFPYRIVYYLRESDVRIVAVAHQRRRPGFWKGRA